MNGSSNKSASSFNALTLLLLVLACASVAFCVYQLTAQKPVRLKSDSKLVLYDGPKSMASSQNTQITVSDKPLFVYETAVNNTHTWVNSGLPELSNTPIAYFDLDGEADIKITTPNSEDITSCEVTPKSHGITPKIDGKTVTFSVSKPGSYTVLFNDSVVNAVHIFVNPIEQSIPDKNDPNVVFIEPGEYNVNTIMLKSNQTLYLSGGAVIHGSIVADKAENVKVLGRGIIDGSANPSWTQKGQTAVIPLDFKNSKNVEVSGIIFLNPNAWTLNSFQSQDGVIKNVKIISARPNGDGITLQSCKNFKVSDSFVRSWDDSLVVKNYEANSDNISFDNMTIWTDLAQSCEVGYETNKGNLPNAEISNISFTNITILNNFHKPVISIHNSDDALVHDISFKDIIVENAQMGSGDAGDNNQLIDFTIASSGWSTTKSRGIIRDVTVENVKVLKGVFPPSRISGYDETHMVENVTLTNIEILGQKITSLDMGKITKNPFTKNINLK